MPVVPTKEIVDRAFADRYGVGAFNILDDLTIDAVLAAAEEERAPVILQTSVKTVRAYGRDRLLAVFQAMARDVSVPVALHLDHCPYRDVISECVEAGWNSVLFDAHELEIADNLEQTKDVVAEARRYGAHVEGEIEGIEGKEDDIGSDDASKRQSLQTAVDFITATGVDICRLLRRRRLLGGRACHRASDVAARRGGHRAGHAQRRRKERRHCLLRDRLDPERRRRRQVWQRMRRQQTGGDIGGAWCGRRCRVRDAR